VLCFLGRVYTFRDIDSGFVLHGNGYALSSRLTSEKIGVLLEPLSITLWVYIANFLLNPIMEFKMNKGVLMSNKVLGQNKSC